MAEEKGKWTPPYATYKTLNNFLNGLQETSIPTRIDRSVLGNMSGGVAYSILAALKSLRLIDENGVPDTMLHRLVNADEDARKSVWEEILRRSYSAIFDNLDLASASAGEFNDCLRDEYGISGSTVDKSASFFLTAAADCGIDLSAHLKARKPIAPSRSSRKKKDGTKQNGAPPSPPPPPTPAAPPKALSHILIDMLDPSTMDASEMDAVWTLVKYQKNKEASEQGE